MAVAPLVVTEPATSLPPPLNLNVSVVKVEPFIYIEKIAHTNVSIATSVAPLDGLVEFILNIVSEGGSSGPDAEPVIIATYTYRQMHREVCRFANVLKKRGIRKGDRVAIYMPMIPQLVVSMLACARIGAIHNVVFAGFSSEALRERIRDS